MKIPRVTTIDFETFAIQGRPDYPPAPVSVSIKPWGKKARFYAWGHPEANNCVRQEAVEALKKAYSNPDGILCHNGKFDLDVAKTHLGMAPPPWDRVHETIFLLFLDDPHGQTYGLKPAAQRVLGLPPEERDVLVEWLKANFTPPGGGRLKTSEAGAYIAYAPGTTVVGPYANGDVERTELLFRHLYPRIVEAGMLRAYDRERQLVPILLDMERRGIRVDLLRLRSDVETYQRVRAKIDSWIRKRLGCGPEVNLQSGGQLLEALQGAGIVDTSKMPLTEKSRKVSTNKSSLALGVTDRQVAAVLAYDAQLHTCLATFMEPWLATAERSGGLIYTTWNQTPSERGGARTGRFSSTPNFQNIPKEFAPLFFHEEAGLPRAERRGLPKQPFPLPPLPMCRSYVVPMKKGHALVGRDFSQQEPRILAHFEDGALMEQYQKNPWIDYHDNAKEHLERIFKRPFKRKPVKNINLGIIYGQGVTSLAAKNGESYEETKSLRNAIFSMYPGLKDLYSEMRRRAKVGEPLTTWGGRVFYCEPPAIVNGKIMEFDYKMVNALIQGSAAECTKEAMIRYYQNKPGGHFLLLSVHDELVLSCPANELVRGMEVLRRAMESVEFEVKILSEGSWSTKSWADMVDYDKKGKIVANTDIPRQKKVFI